MQSTSGSPPIKGPSQVRSCLKRFAGTRSSKEPSDPRVSRGSTDMKHKKRVKFSEHDAFHATCHRPDVSSLSSDRSYASRCNDPKTSEYKSFMKLLEEAGRNSHSHKPAIQDDILSSSHVGDLKNEYICDEEDIGLALPVEMVTPMDQEPSVSPIGALNDKGVENFVASQYKTLGTFYEKRQNLFKSAASVLSLEVNELISAGCDLIPVFLSRLGINRKANNCGELPKMSFVDSNVRSQWPKFPNMQICLGEPSETLETKRTETVVRDIGENNLPDLWRNRDEEISLSMEHVEAQFFPIWNMTKLDFPKHQRHSYFLLDTPYLRARNKSDLDSNPSAEVAISGFRRPMLDKNISTSSYINQEEVSPSWGHYEGQSVLSYSDFPFLEYDTSHTPCKRQQVLRQHSSLPLLGWNEEISNEEELFVTSDSMSMERLHQLPLALYHDPGSHVPVGDSGLIDSCSEVNIFHSGDIRISKDTIYPSLNQILFPPRTEFGLGSEWEDLSTDFFRENLLSHSPNHSSRLTSSNSEFRSCPVGPTDTETGSQSTSTACDFYDLSSIGLELFSERRQMFLLPAANE